jgi:hypothetical protein
MGGSKAIGGLVLVIGLILSFMAELLAPVPEL